MFPILVAKQRLKLLSYTTPTVDSIKYEAPPRFYQKKSLQFWIYKNLLEYTPIVVE